MNFRSVADLNATIVRALRRVPREVDLVVGIPRSGLLAANLLALHLNLPITDLAGLLERRLIDHGIRLSPEPADAFWRRLRRVLVVDDSAHSGTTLRAARAAIAAAKPQYESVFVAVYGAPECGAAADLVFETVKMPRVFEWNLMHHSYVRSACVDIDGVLCCDPTDVENDDGARYAEFLANATPLHLPTVPVGWLVTCRLEKYRGPTETWLARQRISYGELIMMDLPSKEARMSAGSHAAFKAGVYRRTKAELFIESSGEQAREIARLSGRPVLCMSERRLIEPPFLAAVPVAVARGPRRSIVRLKDKLRRWRERLGKVARHS